MSRRKVETLRALAERFARGELSDQTFLQASDEEIEAALTAIPGIGPWTVHGFLIIALDRPDVVLPGDLALRRAIRRLRPRPDADRAGSAANRRALAAYRSLAVSYLFASEFET
jgi:DNA-3-methyladenine glycosylase II